MLYKIIIINNTTHKLIDGVVNLHSITFFTRKLAEYDWLLVQHSRIDTGINNKLIEISVGEEKDINKLNEFNV